jgi:hypothetical protein
VAELVGREAERRLGDKPKVTTLLSKALPHTSAFCILPSRSHWSRDAVGVRRVPRSQAFRVVSSHRPAEHSWADAWARCAVWFGIVIPVARSTRLDACRQVGSRRNDKEAVSG